MIVSGCLPQRFRDELPALLPEVDAFIGIDQVSQIPAAVKKAMARRAKKTKSKVRSSRSKVVGRIAELESRRAATETKLAPLPDAPGTRQKSGASRPASDLASSGPEIPPVFDVTLRPRYIPDYATPGSG